MVLVLASLLLGGAGQGADFTAEYPGRQNNRREGQEHEQGQLPRHEHDGRNADDERENLAEQLGQGQRKRVLNLADVGGDARGNGAHAVLLEERDGQLHELAVKCPPDVADRELAHLGEKPDASERE